VSTDAFDHHPGARILVIDDNADVRTMLADLLESLGYEVVEAENAVDGIHVIQREAPKIVLLDINMPGLSGAEALPTILALAPRTAVIMISGNSDEELAKRTLAHGAFDYLVKPVSYDYLARTVGAALALSALDA
jgi:DNA-binding NtrC family response regulator